MKIYNDLLSILESKSDNREVVLTQLQLKLAVPFDRLKQYLSTLKELDLIDQTSLKLTNKGKQYIREYKKFLEFMKRMGIAYR